MFENLTCVIFKSSKQTSLPVIRDSGQVVAVSLDKQQQNKGNIMQPNEQNDLINDDEEAIIEWPDESTVDDEAAFE